jgi:regulation of enolase protein 1 (concanavalin A-like superfamily)
VLDYISVTFDNNRRTDDMLRRTLLIGISVFVFMLSLGTISYSLESLDIGDAADKPGSTEISPDGTVTIVGAGHDIWDKADGFRYVYMPISGDFEAAVQITFFERVKQWAKAGLMARQSVDADSKNAISTAAAGNVPGPDLGVQLTWRADKAGDTTELDYWDLGGPTGFNDGEWVKIKRAGSDFSASWSKDGKTWVADYASVKIEMTDPILIGLIVCSCDAALSCKSTFKSFTVNNKNVLAVVSSNGKLSKTWGEIKSEY